MALITTLQLLVTVFATIEDFATEQHLFVPELQIYIHNQPLGLDPSNLQHPSHSCIHPLSKVAHEPSKADICLLFQLLVQQIIRADVHGAFLTTLPAVTWQVQTYTSTHQDPIAILHLAPKLTPPA